MLDQQLDNAQSDSVNMPDNVLVVACPGSGKTRVLTSKIIKELTEIDEMKKIVVAITYTNRAAEEIQRRLDDSYIPTAKLWTGTIHAFCLEWILKPYGCYSQRIKNGYELIDQDFHDRILNSIKKQLEIKNTVETRLDKNGKPNNSSKINQKAAFIYHKYLTDNKLIDFDLIIYISYRLLLSYPNISLTLSNLFHLICIDEYQDTQDLQYAIICEIVKHGNNPPKLFIVGDVDQAIYTSLGGLPKSKEEIQIETGKQFAEVALSGCYRSTQRIVDFYRHFQMNDIEIEAKGANKGEQGLITLNRTINKAYLYPEIARLITLSLERGTKPNDICVVTPRWDLVIECARSLKRYLPDVGFDAPGLSPFRYDPDNIWYRITRLYFTQTSPQMYSTRLRWANEILSYLEHNQITLNDNFNEKRFILRILNSIFSDELNGFKHLKEVFDTLLLNLDISINEYPILIESQELFFAKAIRRCKDHDLPYDIQSLRKLYKEKNGIVFNTCHGLKGEEYDTVIAFGMLYGYIPFWRTIIEYPDDKLSSAKKLLYVVCSRAKNNLHLFAEQGRITTNGNPLSINSQLEEVCFQYD